MWRAGDSGKFREQDDLLHLPSQHFYTAGLKHEIRKIYILMFNYLELCMTCI